MSSLLTLFVYFFGANDKAFLPSLHFDFFRIIFFGSHELKLKRLFSFSVVIYLEKIFVLLRYELHVAIEQSVRIDNV